MSSPFDPDPPTDSVLFYTFEQWQAKADTTDPDEQKQNLVAINAAIDWSSRTKVPVIGLGNRTYPIRQPDIGSGSILMKSDATVICQPGCVISYAFSHATFPLVTGVSGLERASWIGATFLGIANVANQMPEGDVFDLSGSDLLLQGIQVTGYRTGRAFVLNGDNVSLVDAKVLNGTATLGTAQANQDGGGILFTGGDAFRCRDAVVDVNGDALVLSPKSSDAISNAVCTGLNGRSNAAAVLAIETDGGDITDACVEGLYAHGTSLASRVRIRNMSTTAPASTKIDAVTIRDAHVRCADVDAASAADVVLVQGGVATSTTARVSNISLENFVVRCPNWATTGTVLRVTALGTRPVSGFRWIAGGVGGYLSGKSGAPTTPNLFRQYAVLSHVDDAVFGGLALDLSAAAQPLVVGDGATCNTVVFSDTVLTRLAASAKAVTFDRANASGFVRGAISGDTGASFTAAWLTLHAVNCYVEGTDLTVNANTGDKVLVNATAPYRLADNFGSTQRSPVGFGSPVDTAIDPATFTAVPASSFLALGPSGATLKTVDTSRSQPGDLLVLTAQAGGAVTITRATSTPAVGNIRLHQPSVPLGNGGRDTLTLLCRGVEWSEVADSQNG